MSKFAGVAAEYIVALAVVLFFACYGGNPSIIGAVNENVTLVFHTIVGKEIFQNYFEIYPPGIWYSARLVLLATTLGSVGGFLLSIWRIQIHNRIAQGITNGILTVLESVPDDMYVIITTILVLYLYEHFGIELPIFPDTHDPSFIDTVVPAVALALPSVSTCSASCISTSMTNSLRNMSPLHFRKAHPGAGHSTDMCSRTPIPSFFAICLWLPELSFQSPSLLNSSLITLLIASDWTQISGVKMPGFMLGGFVPEYQAGSIWVIGALVVTLWFVARTVAALLKRLTAPVDSVNAKARQTGRVQ